MTIEEFLNKDFPSKDKESILFILKGKAVAGMGPYLVVEKTYYDNYLFPGRTNSYDKKSLLTHLYYEYGFIPKTVYLLNTIIEEFEEELV